MRLEMRGPAITNKGGYVRLAVDQSGAEIAPEFNSVGVKGLGEVSMVGVAAVIGNAIYHAAGRRVRDLPIRIEHLLD